MLLLKWATSQSFCLHPPLLSSVLLVFVNCIKEDFFFLDSGDLEQFFKMALSCEEQMEFNKSGEIFLSDLQKTLYEKLLCPICLDLIKNTMTTVECLHRFCSDCIVKSLQPGNGQCPVCSMKIELKKNLKPDPKFDTLISMIFPSRGMYKAFQNKVKENFNECREENEIELVLRVHPSPNSIDSCVKISRDVVRYVKADDHTTSKYFLSNFLKLFQLMQVIKY